MRDWVIGHSSLIRHSSFIIRHSAAIIAVATLIWATTVAASVERFPAPEFRTGYKWPATPVPVPRAPIFTYVDIGLLVAALSVSAWLAFKRRSRRGVFVLMLASLLYFGFYRKGCVCPVGSIQNVALAAGTGYALPWGAAALFAIPLLFTLFFGRVFCAGVCPLGAVQDVVLWKPIRVAPWLETGLGLFAYLYFGAGVLFAATGSDFVICRYDPFVAFFRLSGAAHILFVGGVILLASMFVGRVYCRFICPYSVLLKLLAPFSKRQITITPDNCVDCRLCEQACPFGAIRHPTPPLPSRARDTGRRQLQLALLSLPLWVAGFTFLGYLGGPALSRVDATVRLAERVWQEEHHKVSGTTDESTAFRGRGESIESLYRTAATIQRKLVIGSALLGTWIGLAVGLKLIGAIVRRRRSGYTADAATCLACARCYLSCPVEHEKRQEREEELVAV